MEVEVVKPLKDLRSWADARFDAIDPHVAALVEIISGSMGYVLTGPISKDKVGRVCVSV